MGAVATIPPPVGRIHAKAQRGVGLNEVADRLWIVPRSSAICRGPFSKYPLLTVEVLGDLRLGLGRLFRKSSSRRSSVARIQVGCHPGWHRRHRLAAGQFQTKPLEALSIP